MWQKELPSGLRRILPTLTAFSALVWCHAGSPVALRAFEDSTNELNSPIDEPTVIIPESHAAVPVRPVSRAVQESKDELVKFVYETREAQRRRLLSTNEHTPWQIMHGLVGLREDLLLRHNGQIVSGLDWIATGPMYQNEPWFMKTSHGGQAHPFNKPWWFEGHINQFAAILSMASVPLDQQFGTPKGPITMRDMIRNAQMTVNAKEEVTWTLWLLSRYLPPDAQWKNAKGESWSIEKIVKVEIGKPVGGPTSPCGGTHGLFALAHARNVYLRTGKPLRGVWLEADQKIQKYIRTARVQSNPNGTLSSSFFKGREYKQDFDKRMASCGHLLEFLMMAVPQNQLNDQWLRTAIHSTAKDLMDNRKEFVSCSPLYHATNGLSIYLDRVAPTTPEEKIAQRPENTKTISQSKTLPADSNLKPDVAKSNASKPDSKSELKDKSTAEVLPKSDVPAVPTTTTTPSADPKVEVQPLVIPNVPDAAVPQSNPSPTPPSEPQVTPAHGAPADPPKGESPSLKAAPATPAATASEPTVDVVNDDDAPREALEVTPKVVELEAKKSDTGRSQQSAGPSAATESLSVLTPVPLMLPASSEEVVAPLTSGAPSTSESGSSDGQSEKPIEPEQPSDPDKPRGTWKATPPDRRRPLIVSKKSA